MITFALVTGGLFMIDIILHLVAIVKDKEMLRRVTKILLMPLLALVFILVWGASRALDLTPWLITAAMLMGCIGDTCLVNHHHPVGFPLGLVAFSAGHVLYLLQMFPLLSVPAWWMVALIVMVYGVGVAVTFTKLSPFLPKRLWALCLFYMVLLSGLSAVAAVGVLANFQIGSNIVFVGTLLFMLSDTTLSFEIFRGETKWGNLKVMVTYIAAQIFLAVGFFLWVT